MGILLATPFNELFKYDDELATKTAKESLGVTKNLFPINQNYK